MGKTAGVTNWQAELSFLDWAPAGHPVLVLDNSGQWGYRCNDGTCVPLSDPRLHKYRSFLECETQKWLAETMQAADKAHESIADPDNVEPIPRSILRKKPELAAWLIDKNPQYLPTAFELRILRPAFIERWRKIKERGLAGQSVRPIVVNDFQKQILKALDGRALPKQALAVEVCGGEGSRLYRKGGIKELMGAGKVENKRRLGYFRPDSPPLENVVN